MADEVVYSLIDEMKSLEDAVQGISRPVAVCLNIPGVIKDFEPTE